MDKNEKLAWGFRGSMAVVVIMVFLPWATVGMGAFSVSASGIEDWRGVLSLLVAVAGAALSFFSVGPLAGKEKPIAIGSGIVIVFLCFLCFIEIESPISAGFGLVVALLGGVTGTVTGFMADWSTLPRNLNVGGSSAGGGAPATLTFQEHFARVKSQCMELLRDRVIGPTIISAFAWLLFVFEWMTSHVLPTWLRLIVFTAAMLYAAWWVWRTWPLPRIKRLAVWSTVYIVFWQWSVFFADYMGWFGFRVTLASVGLGGLFLIGLIWTVWGVEKGAQHYHRLRKAAARLGKSYKEPALPDTPMQSTMVGNAMVAVPAQFYPDEKTWNPVDLEAWYYGQRQKKLHQSLATVFTYTLVFFLLVMLIQSLQGCQEIYEMPSGGGEEKQKPRVVQIKKVIHKKLVFNELSKVIMKPPPIEEIQVINQEITKHLYEIGQGKGKGAGFSGGTNKGKVRFIRLEYSGGDWDQDFGLGGDLNMLLRYGIETGHKVNDRTESRTIGQLDNFPKYKSPPLVYITGQRAIGVSKNEIKVLREYILEKHGMVFADNGGSSQWHSQFFRLMDQVLEGEGVVPVKVPLDDRIHSIPFKLPFLPYVAPHGGKEAWGWWKDGRWVAYYHPGDIGDAWADGHAGVRREVYEACYHLGVNVIFYAHAEYNKWLEATKPEDE